MLDIFKIRVYNSDIENKQRKLFNNSFLNGLFDGSPITK